MRGAGRRTLRAVSAPEASHAQSAPGAVKAPGLRDAQAIAARIAADEAAADIARVQFAANGIPAIPPGTAFARVARAGEALHAVCRHAILERAPLEGNEPVVNGGTLYLTSRRLLHVGVETTELPLSEIEEMVVALERLVLIRLRDGSDLAVEVDQPRLLRVQIAAALAAERASAGRR